MKVFISAVSSEFEAARDELATDLQSIPVEVKVQRSFRQHDGVETLLELLHDYIRDADRTIAIVGSRSGAFPPDDSVREDFRHLLPEVMIRASYTQWEVIFARHYQKGRVFYYRPTGAYDPDRPPADFDDETAQAAWLRWLENTDAHYVTFDNKDRLIREVVKIGWPERGKKPPRHIPFGSIGTLFKGREDFLEEIKAAYAGGKPGVALHGLGGIGKTRTALEFALSQEADLTALLFLTAKSQEDLNAGIASLVGPLVMDLDAKNDPRQEAQVAAAIRWLNSNPGWFLILDNVDTEDAAQEVQNLLAKLTGGRILITSRISAWGAQVEPLELNVISPEAAVEYLMSATPRRRSEPEPEIAAAAIAEDLGHLSLALVQAASFINEEGETFEGYRNLWEKNRKDLMATHDSRTSDYLDPVAVTWLTTFAQLSEEAQDLLNLLSCLSVEPVPEDLLAAEDDLAWSRRKALKELTRYSLATRDPDAPEFTVHRLVQSVSRDRWNQKQKERAQKKALNLMAAALPRDTSFDVREWPNLIALVPHAEALTESIGAEGGDKLSHVLSILAGLVEGISRLQNSEDLFKRTPLKRDAELQSASPREIREMAMAAQDTNRLQRAEALFRRALSIDEANRGPNHPDVASGLNNLAELLRKTNRLDEAEPLYQRALHINEAKFGPDHQAVATGLNNLGRLLEATGRLAEAEPLYQRALHINEAIFGPDHPTVATALNNLGRLLEATGRLAEAEPLYQRALHINEAIFGPNHPTVATGLNNLGRLLEATGRLAEAEPLYQRALFVTEANFGLDHPSVAIRLNNLADLLQVTGRLDEAEPLYRRALRIDKNSYGTDHPNVASDLNNLAQLLHETNRMEQAEELYYQALRINENSYGPDHMTVAGGLYNLARLLNATGRLKEAEPLYRRGLLLLWKFQKSTGHIHPKAGVVLARYMQALKEIGHDEASIFNILYALYDEAGITPPNDPNV